MRRLNQAIPHIQRPRRPKINPLHPKTCQLTRYRSYHPLPRSQHVLRQNVHPVAPLRPFIQIRTAKRKSVVSLLSLPQGALALDPLPDPRLFEPEEPIYSFAISQVRSHMDKFTDCVVLTRVGSFYELYFEHAEEIGPLLGLKIAEKRAGRGLGKSIPMAGFPYFQLDRFLKILVYDLNRHVAIADEYPNPNKENREHASFGLLFDRRVTRIITPGTLIDEKFMDPYENNYLLCVYPATSTAPSMTLDTKIAAGLNDEIAAAVEDGGNTPVGLAWLDLSTGDFFTQLSTSGSLTSELERIGPKEIVFDESSRSTPVVQRLEAEKRLMTFHTSSMTPDMSDWSGLLEPGSSTILSGEQFRFSEEEVAAGSTLLSYVKEKLQGLSMKLQPPIRRSVENSMLIDATTMRALEVKRTMKEGVSGGVGTLLKAIRRTLTRGGARRLTEWLTSPETSVKVINDRLNIVEHFICSPGLLDGIRRQLKLTHDSQRLIQKISIGRGDADDLVALARTIFATKDVVECLTAHLPEKPESLHIMNVLLSRISLQTKLAKKIIESIDETGLRLQHTMEDLQAAELTEFAEAVQAGDVVAINPAENEDEDPLMSLSRASDEETSSSKKKAKSQDKKPKEKTKAKRSTATRIKAQRMLKEADREKLEPWIMHQSASKTLSRLHDDLQTLMADKATLELRILDEGEISEHLMALKWTPSLGHIMYIKSRNPPEMTTGVLAPAIKVGSSKSTHSYHLPEWTRLGSRIEMARLAIRTEEQKVLQGLRKEVILNIQALRRNAAVLDEMDVTASFAVLAKEGGWVRPILNMSTGHKIIGGRHPTVQTGLVEQGRSFTANDCFVGDEETIWIITGPNMAGKSTFLRQNALISILAQIGSYVPAEHAEIGIIDQIFSRVGSADDLYRSQSTFMVEMLETAFILRNATERSFVIMDEVGRGTTVEDGFAVAGGVLKYLWEKTGCRVLFATHFHGLVDVAQSWEGGDGGKGRVGAYCTDVLEDGEGGWSYVHKLRKGVNRKSHALKVARMAGLPVEAITAAEEILIREDDNVCGTGRGR